MTARSPPAPGYLVCTHPRAGSTYFCQLLASTGKLGTPAEYFNEGYMLRRFADPGNLAHLPGQFAYFLDHAATANGVRGCKMFWFDLQRLARANLLHRFRGYRFVLLERGDKLAHAISVSRALQSGKLRADMTQSDEHARYDYSHIRLRLVRLLDAEDRWRGSLAEVAADAVHCLYEDLMDDPQRAVDHVAEAVGLGEPAPIDPAQVSVRVQRDARSSEWYARFAAEAQANDPELLVRAGHAAR
jgi:LPS sulfotransferase NodH